MPGSRCRGLPRRPGEQGFVSPPVPPQMPPGQASESGLWRVGTLPWRGDHPHQDCRTAAGQAGPSSRTMASSTAQRARSLAAHPE